MDMKNRIAAKLIFTQWNINSMQQHLESILATHEVFTSIYHWTAAKGCMTKTAFEENKWNIMVNRYLRREEQFWLEAHSFSGENVICLRRRNQLLLLQVWEWEQWQAQEVELCLQMDRWFNLRQIEQGYVCHYDDIWWQDSGLELYHHPDYRRFLFYRQYQPWLSRRGLQNQMDHDEVYHPACWKMWLRQRQSWFGQLPVGIVPLVQGWQIQLYDRIEEFWQRDNHFLQGKVQAGQGTE